MCARKKRPGSTSARNVACGVTERVCELPHQQFLNITLMSLLRLHSNRKLGAAR